MDEGNYKIKLDNENMLVEQAKTDNRAFEALYDFYFEKIYFFVFRRVRQKEAAEDIVSSTFIKVFTGLNKFKAKNDNSFAAWVYQIASNNLIDYYRRQKKYLTTDIASIAEPVDLSQNPETDFSRNLDRGLVAKSINKLGERDQKLLQLKFFADLDNIEIAQILNTKPNNVGVWLFRALKRFQKEYQKYE
jgi:RNA polymerase sigma-70 factor (ECF subfamily)